MTVVMTLIAALTAVVYLSASCMISRRIPVSMSATAGLFRSPVVWVSAVWTVCAMLMMPMMDATEWKGMAFLSVASLAGVGASPLVKRHRNTFHNVCAFTSAAASTVIVIAERPVVLCVWLPYVVATLYDEDRRKWSCTFIAEVCCFMQMITICLTNN